MTQTETISSNYYIIDGILVELTDDERYEEGVPAIVRKFNKQSNEKELFLGYSYYGEYGLYLMNKNPSKANEDGSSLFEAYYYG
jgi:hypothetical protein